MYRFADVEVFMAAIPAHDMRILGDHGSRQVGEGFDPPVPSFTAPFSIRHDRLWCCKQTQLIMAAPLPPMVEIT